MSAFAKAKKASPSLSDISGAVMRVGATAKPSHVARVVRLTPYVYRRDPQCVHSEQRGTCVHECPFRVSSPIHQVRQLGAGIKDRALDLATDINGTLWKSDHDMIRQKNRASYLNTGGLGDEEGRRLAIASNAKGNHRSSGLG